MSEEIYMYCASCGKLQEQTEFDINLEDETCMCPACKAVSKIISLRTITMKTSTFDLMNSIREDFSSATIKYDEETNLINLVIPLDVYAGIDAILFGDKYVVRFDELAHGKLFLSIDLDLEA